ncbi:MAG: hypothetical protein HZA53_17200 [Planctomycetes bacterium]|nr:hypothetical protein [Planctomycetota bacterium]
MRWNGATWTGGPFSPLSQVYDLRALDQGGGPRLFAASAYSNDRSRLERFDGGAWTMLGGEFAGPPATTFAQASLGAGRRLVVGGAFTSAGGVHAPRVAVLENGAWRALGGGNGVSGEGLECFHVFDDGSGPALYAGGSIHGAGGVAANNVARWNGTSWTSVGADFVWPVHALATFDDGTGPALYASSEDGVARWNGTSWVSITGALAWERVLALAVFDSGQGPELIASGHFMSIGSVSARRIAAWNGSSWRQLGSGLDGSIYALAVHDDGSGPKLYAGGNNDFLHTTNPPPIGVVRWDGNQWSGLGVCPVTRVRSFTVHDDGNGPALVVGGLAYASPSYVPRVARWWHGQWAMMGGVLGDPGREVRALASIPDANGPALYAGGNFVFDSAHVTGGLAKWKATHWDPIEPGLAFVTPWYGAANALAAFPQGAELALCVGGDFASAGGRIAHDFATLIDRTPFVPHVPREAGPAEPAPTGVPFCTGDGGAGACPCANFGTSGHGCRSGSIPQGALLEATGAESVTGDTVRLGVGGLPFSSSLVNFLQGTQPLNGGLGAPVFDGLACLDGTVLRIATKFSAANSASYPEFFDLPLSVAGELSPAGGMRHYQVQYRDPSVGYCTPSAVNWTNGLTLVWRP